MGLFDFFKKKKTAGSAEATPPSINTNEAPPNNDICLSYPPYLELMEPCQKNFHQLPERSNLIEIAKILSNNAPQVTEDIALLANDPPAFFEKYQAWCTEQGWYYKEGWYDDYDGPLDTSVLAAYWLTGYETPFKYGDYRDWKAETEDVLWGLKQAIEKQGYTITMDDMVFTEQEATNEVLEKINTHLLKQAYALVTLNTYSDCYHLFVVPVEKYNPLRELGKSIGIDFYNQYV